MKTVDLDKRLSAYQDGALADGKRARLERDLESDPALARQLERSRALGSLVREAWTEGPAAPAPELLLARLRPDLAAIARERRERPAWLRALEQARTRLAGLLGPVPLATSAAAFLLALALLPREGAQVPSLSALLPTQPALESAAPPAAGARARAAFPGSSVPFAPANLSPDAAAGVYDLAPGEHPAMIFQNEDGSTLLWLLQNDDLSRRFGRSDRWG